MFYRLCLSLIFAASAIFAQTPGRPIEGPGPAGLTTGAELVLDQKREAIVYAVTIRGEGPKTRGGTSRVLISMEENPEEFAPVSLGGDYVGGQGMMWRSTAWIAAMCATQTAGKLLTDKHFVVRVGGLIDGPSAGMLMGATMLALINHADIPGDATMTGAINTDGSAAPVGGIPAKIAGAKALKDPFTSRPIIKKFGYPAGSRFCTDPRTGKQVDLQDPAVNLGLQAVEIRDVYDAYELLTGKPLARPQPGDASILTLSSELAKEVRGLSESLRASASGMIEAVGAGEKGSIAEDVKAARRYLEDSLQADSQARTCEAMYRAIVGHVLGNVSGFLVELRKTRESHDVGRSLTLLSTRLAEAKAAMANLDKVVSASLSHETVGGRVDALNLFLQFSECRAYWETANKRTRGISNMVEAFKALPAGAKADKAALYDEIDSQLLSTITVLSIAQSRMEVTRLLAATGGREAGKTVKPAADDLLRLSKAYSFCAVANFELLNAMFFAPVAEKQGKSLESLLSRLEKVDDSYALLRTTADESIMDGLNMLDDLPEDEKEREAELKKREEEGKLHAIAQLGSSLYALVGVTDMLQKNSAFGGRMNEDTKKMEMTNSSAIATAMELSRKRVLEEIGEVQRTLGFVPDSVKINFDLARSLEASSKDADRLTALRAYKRCFFLCSFARLISAF